MPYIPESERKHCGVAGVTPYTEGQLNYMVTTLVDDWLDSQGVCYKNINAAVGVLECAKLELYSRVARVYEDQKCFDNGDVYECLGQMK